tara:strand:+ start:11192 stop:11407 length:216 start_codon:yes stop_codon:yes gene_type:complete
LEQAVIIFIPVLAVLYFSAVVRFWGGPRRAYSWSVLPNALFVAGVVSPFCEGGAQICRLAKNNLDQTLLLF